MTKAMAIQLIRYYTEEYLPLYTSKTILPIIFEERVYKRYAAKELAETIRNSKENDPYKIVCDYEETAIRCARRVKADHVRHAYECSRQVACDILDVMEAMEDDHENQALGFKYS